MIIPTDLREGDFFGVPAGEPMRTLCKGIFAPETEFFHFGLIKSRREDGDFEILESLGTYGLRIGLLSWYKDKELGFFRVNCPGELRKEAPQSLVKFGRSRYDYFLFAKLIVSILNAFINQIKNKTFPHKLFANDISKSYVWDKSLICTEAVYIAYSSVGVNIIPYGIVPIPSAYKEAENEKLIYRI